MESEAPIVGSTSFHPGSRDAQLSSMLPVMAQFDINWDLAARSAISELDSPVQAQEFRALKAAHERAELDLSPCPIGTMLSIFHPNSSGIGSPSPLQQDSTESRSPCLSSFTSLRSSMIWTSVSN